MTDILHNALILLVLLQIKHMLADFYLQAPRMLVDRDRYLHMGRAQHAAVHAVGSAIGLLLMGTALPIILLITAAEWLAHYHIDWGKSRYSNIMGYTPNDPGFWRAFGFDQALHQLTFVCASFRRWLNSLSVNGATESLE